MIYKLNDIFEGFINRSENNIENNTGTKESIFKNSAILYDFSKCSPQEFIDKMPSILKENGFIFNRTLKDINKIEFYGNSRKCICFNISYVVKNPLIIINIIISKFKLDIMIFCKKQENKFLYYIKEPFKFKTIGNILPDDFLGIQNSICFDFNTSLFETGIELSTENFSKILYILKKVYSDNMYSYLKKSINLIRKFSTVTELNSYEKHENYENYPGLIQNLISDVNFAFFKYLNIKYKDIFYDCKQVFDFTEMQDISKTALIRKNPELFNQIFNKIFSGNHISEGFINRNKRPKAVDLKNELNPFYIPGINNLSTSELYKILTRYIEDITHLKNRPNLKEYDILKDNEYTLSIKWTNTDITISILFSADGGSTFEKLSSAIASSGIGYRFLNTSMYSSKYLEKQFICPDFNKNNHVAMTSENLYDFFEFISDYKHLFDLTGIFFSHLENFKSPKHDVDRINSIKQPKIHNDDKFISASYCRFLFLNGIKISELPLNYVKLGSNLKKEIDYTFTKLKEKNIIKNVKLD